MRVTIGEDTLKYNTDQLNVEDLFNQINCKLNEKNYIFSYLVIDGIEIYENHDAYIMEKIELIDEIEVIYITQHQFVVNTWKATIDYFYELMPQIDELSTDFYQNYKNDLWDKMPQFFEIIDHLLQSYSTLTQVSVLPRVTLDKPNWAGYITCIIKMNKILESLEKPIRSRDTVLIADVMKWDIYPLLSDMQHHLQKLVAGEEDLLEY